MLNNKWYIIRKGDFAVDANKKIFYTLFSIGLCIEDYRQSNSADCLSIMLGSSIVWTLIEFYLHVSGTRVMKPMYITKLRDDKVLVPKYLALCLQGTQEGGVVTTFGLFFGDRLFDGTYFILFHIFIGYIIMNMLSKDSIPYHSRVSSRRQVNTPGSLGIMTCITAYNSNKLYSHPEHAWRQFTMFFAMVYVCTIWTVISYYKNFRGTEVQVIGHNSKPYRIRRRPVDVFLILGYDVIFEIGVAYITFYNWFVMR